MLPRLMTPADVQARYRLADVRSARALMHRIGAVRVGGRLYVREDDLDAWEREQTKKHAPPVLPGGRPAGRSLPSDALRPYWWKDPHA